MCVKYNVAKGLMHQRPNVIQTLHGDKAGSCWSYNFCCLSGNFGSWDDRADCWLDIYSHQMCRRFHSVPIELAWWPSRFPSCTSDNRSSRSHLFSGRWCHTAGISWLLRLPPCSLTSALSAELLCRSLLGCAGHPDSPYNSCLCGWLCREGS